VESLASQSSTVVPPSDLLPGEWVRLMWGFFWRSILYTLASAIGGAIAGAIVGFFLGLVMAVVGYSPEEIRSSARLIGGILGLVVAVVLLRYYVEWILRGRYGDLRLAVVRKGTLRGNVLDESAAGSPVTFTSAGN